MRKIVTILIIALAIWAVIPTLITVQTSFASAYVFGIPSNISLNNWRWMRWDMILVWAKNSLIVVGPSVVLSVIISCMAGYGFARYDFPGKNIAFTFVVATMVVPPFILFVPRFVMMARMGLYNSHIGMILPVILNPAGVFFAKQYYSAFDEEILESARLDGADEWQIFWRILLPLSKSLIVIAAIFAFSAAWGDLLWQMIMARDPSLRTLIVGLATTLTGGEQVMVDLGHASKQGIEAAISTLVAIPPMALFIAFSKYFVSGLKIEMGGLE